MIDEFMETITNYNENPCVTIHPSAIVSEKAQLEDGVVIGPRAMIGPGVHLGKDVMIGPGAVVSGRTTIGERTKVYAMATLGTDPQDLKFKGEPTQLVIGSDNMIREYVNISTGTVGGGGVTTIGDHNLIMAYSHIAHDCHIDHHCILANGVQLAGHVHVGHHAVFGGMSGGHQFCSFGEYAMIAAGAIVVQDVPPFVMVQGDRATVTGLNKVGLRRAGLTGEKHQVIKAMFRIVYRDNLNLSEAILKISQEVADSEVKETFVAFLKKSERGICR